MPFPYTFPIYWANPVARVRIAFDSDPFDATPIWTNIHADVLSLYTKRGRQHELGRMETGIATVQLLNVAGNYWPLNVGGDYYGKVLPGKKINIRTGKKEEKLLVTFSSREELKNLLSRLLHLSEGHHRE